MKSLKTLWRFGRPHTIIGSTVSIITLYVMACNGQTLLPHYLLLILSLITGLGCNIFIVGINQIQDTPIDKINKPQLPLASGELTLSGAYKIIYSAVFISILTAAYISVISLGIVIISTFIGLAYSLPPFHLKKHHLPAALSITIVRGILVNMGVFYVFTSEMYGKGYLTHDVLTLTFFMTIFTIGIAWFKDLPDMEGDSQYNIKTFALLYSPKVAFFMGVILVSIAYLLTIYFNMNMSNSLGLRTSILFYGHLLLFLLFITNVIFTRVSQQMSLIKFYKRYWLFFFAEYCIYLAAYL